MSEPKVFLLPDLGEGLTEAELVNWLVAVGDEIRVDQPIAEVETAKSMVEVPSPYAGTVALLHGEPGQTLDVGKPLISVTPVGAATVAPTETPAAESAESADIAAEVYREEEKAGSGNVLIGYGTPGGHGVARRTRARKTSAGSAVSDQDVPRSGLFFLAVDLGCNFGRFGRLSHRGCCRRDRGSADRRHRDERLADVEGLPGLAVQHGHGAGVR